MKKLKKIKNIEKKNKKKTESKYGRDTQMTWPSGEKIIKFGRNL